MFDRLKGVDGQVVLAWHPHNGDVPMVVFDCVVPDARGVMRVHPVGQPDKLSLQITVRGWSFSKASDVAR